MLFCEEPTRTGPRHAGRWAGNGEVGGEWGGEGRLLEAWIPGDHLRDTLDTSRPPLTFRS